MKKKIYKKQLLRDENERSRDSRLLHSHREPALVMWTHCIPWFVSYFSQNMFRKEIFSKIGLF